MLHVISTRNYRVAAEATQDSYGIEKSERKPSFSQNKHAST